MRSVPALHEKRIELVSKIQKVKLEIMAVKTQRQNYPNADNLARRQYELNADLEALVTDLRQIKAEISDQSAEEYAAKVARAERREKAGIRLERAFIDRAKMMLTQETFYKIYSAAVKVSMEAGR